ncbi:MAG: hypothetical protein GX410_06840 [Elusimicrobia bacterium]|nr:hypothetical protein [Elusimicrobiota bacterium]
MIRLAIIASLAAGVAQPLLAHDHDTDRTLTGPGIALTESAETGVISGDFRGLKVRVAPVEEASRCAAGYEGWAERGGVKMPMSLSMENGIISADFNGFRFSHAKTLPNEKAYVFYVPLGQVSVAFDYEAFDGHHMANPVFTVPGRDGDLSVRVEGEACLRHGLYYAALLYGLGVTAAEAR